MEILEEDLVHQDHQNLVLLDPDLQVLVEIIERKKAEKIEVVEEITQKVVVEVDPEVKATEEIKAKVQAVNLVDQEEEINQKLKTIMVLKKIYPNLLKAQMMLRKKNNFQKFNLKTEHLN